MAFVVKQCVSNWNDVRGYLNGRSDVLDEFSMFTLDSDPSHWKAEDKTTWLYLKGFVGKGDQASAYHLSCNIVGGVWTGFHVTQYVDNLHVASLRVVEIDPESDEGIHTGRMLKCIRDATIEVDGKHQKMKISKNEQKKKDKIVASGGKIVSPGHDMSVLVNAMVDVGLEWTT